MKHSRHFKGKYIPLFLIMILIILTMQAQAGVPQVSEIMVTDVTTSSFSVIWKSSEPSFPSLYVFDGPDCSTPTIGAVLTPHLVLSGDATVTLAAENSGIMKVTVTGLSPNTEYCYQTVTTSKSSPETTVAPSVAEKVVTVVQTTRTFVEEGTGALKPFSNDIIVLSILEPDEVTYSEGSLLVAEGPGGSKVTAFVGDGISSPSALADLNNVFDSGTLENLNLLGGETLILREFRGNTGCKEGESSTIVRFRRVPEDNELAEIKDPIQCFFADNDCSGVVNIIDVQRGLNIFNANGGDCNFNSDLDPNADNVVNILDIQMILNRFGQTEPF